MKCYLVSSALFVPGRIMAPFRIEREKQVLLERKARLEHELASIPARLVKCDRAYAALTSEFEQLGVTYLLENENGIR